MSRSLYETKLAESMVESMDIRALMSYVQSCLEEAYRALPEDEFQKELESFGPDGILEEYISSKMLEN